MKIIHFIQELTGVEFSVLVTFSVLVFLAAVTAIKIIRRLRL